MAFCSILLDRTKKSQESAMPVFMPKCRQVSGTRSALYCRRISGKAVLQKACLREYRLPGNNLKLTSLIKKMMLMNCRMKYPSINQRESSLMKKAIKNYFVPVFLSAFFSIPAFSQEFPKKPVPPRLVNDFAGMLTSQEVNALENKLVLFNDSTSTQIAIVSVSDLAGYDKSDYA